ncbi:hypothetical protein P692DRAFT_20820990 [Suillus brevipes Sb2]|nr:hypothetical protein P692DRAFT_20820990 [Suillus brevipes Sb2]
MTLLVSMIAGEYMDMLDEVARHIRGNQLLFGGIQVIGVGDFLQLPPVQIGQPDIITVDFFKSLQCPIDATFLPHIDPIYLFPTLIDDYSRDTNKKLFHNSLVEAKICLKTDMQVISTGCVVGFYKSGQANHHNAGRKDLFPLIKFTTKDGPEWVLVLSSEFSVKIKDTTVAQWFQSVTLVFGQTLMVHKSQSQSLDKVVVDLNKAFADGQAYMALLQDRSKMAWKSGTSNRQKTLRITDDFNELYALCGPPSIPITPPIAKPAHLQADIRPLAKGSSLLPDYIHHIQDLLLQPHACCFLTMSGILWCIALYYRPSGLFASAISVPSTDTLLHLHFDQSADSSHHETAALVQGMELKSQEMVSITNLADGHQFPLLPPYQKEMEISSVASHYGRVQSLQNHWHQSSCKLMCLRVTYGLLTFWL